MVKSITHFRASQSKNHQVVRSELQKHKKKLQCEDDACDHLCWPTDNTVDGKVVKSITNYGVFVIRNHEVARSELCERCQREKTCDAKLRFWPSLVTNRQHCRCKSREKITHSGASQSKTHEIAKNGLQKKIFKKVPMQGWCLWPSLLTDRQHCRRKSG